jgi:holo-[acyl-carrier protein] synthase
MISGIGVDIVDVAAIADSIKNYGDRYLERVFTRREIEYCNAVPTSTQRYAARVAAKEAAMKALATGWESGVEWLDFEIANESSGEPRLRVNGVAAQLLKEKGIYKTWVTLSHGPEFAVAQVVFEKSVIRAVLARLRSLY